MTHSEEWGETVPSPWMSILCCADVLDFVPFPPSPPFSIAVDPKGGRCVSHRSTDESEPSVEVVVVYVCYETTETHSPLYVLSLRPTQHFALPVPSDETPVMLNRSMRVSFILSFRIFPLKGLQCRTDGFSIKPRDYSNDVNGLLSLFAGARDYLNRQDYRSGNLFIVFQL